MAAAAAGTVVAHGATESKDDTSQSSSTPPVKVATITFPPAAASGGGLWPRSSFGIAAGNPASGRFATASFSATGKPSRSLAELESEIKAKQAKDLLASPHGASSSSSSSSSHGMSEDFDLSSLPAVKTAVLEEDDESVEGDADSKLEKPTTSEPDETAVLEAAARVSTLTDLISFHDPVKILECVPESTAPRSVVTSEHSISTPSRRLDAKYQSSVTPHGTVRMPPKDAPLTRYTRVLSHDHFVATNILFPIGLANTILLPHTFADFQMNSIAHSIEARSAVAPLGYLKFNTPANRCIFVKQSEFKTSRKKHSRGVIYRASGTKLGKTLMWDATANLDDLMHCCVVVPRPLKEIDLINRHLEAKLPLGPENFYRIPSEWLGKTTTPPAVTAFLQKIVGKQDDNFSQHMTKHEYVVECVRRLAEANPEIREWEGVLTKAIQGDPTDVHEIYSALIASGQAYGGSFFEIKDELVTDVKEEKAMVSIKFQEQELQLPLQKSSPQVTVPEGTTVTFPASAFVAELCTILTRLICRNEAALRYFEFGEVEFQNHVRSVKTLRSAPADGAASDSPLFWGERLRGRLIYKGFLFQPLVSTSEKLCQLINNQLVAETIAGCANTSLVCFRQGAYRTLRKQETAGLSDYVDSFDVNPNPSETAQSITRDALMGDNPRSHGGIAPLLPSTVREALKKGIHVLNISEHVLGTGTLTIRLGSSSYPYPVGSFRIDLYDPNRSPDDNMNLMTLDDHKAARLHAVLQRDGAGGTTPATSPASSSSSSSSVSGAASAPRLEVKRPAGTLKGKSRKVTEAPTTPASGKTPKRRSTKATPKVKEAKSPKPSTDPHWSAGVSYAQVPCWKFFFGRFDQVDASFWYSRAMDQKSGQKGYGIHPTWLQYVGMAFGNYTREDKHPHLVAQMPKLLKRKFHAGSE